MAPFEPTPGSRDPIPDDWQPDVTITLELRPGLSDELLDALFAAIDSITTGWQFGSYSFDLRGLVPEPKNEVGGQGGEGAVSPDLDRRPLSTNALDLGARTAPPAVRRAHPALGNALVNAVIDHRRKEGGELGPWLNEQYYDS